LRARFVEHEDEKAEDSPQQENQEKIGGVGTAAIAVLDVGLPEL
jgi:hypothetical protein